MAISPKQVSKPVALTTKRRSTFVSSQKGLRKAFEKESSAASAVEAARAVSLGAPAAVASRQLEVVCAG